MDSLLRIFDRHPADTAGVRMLNQAAISFVIKNIGDPAYTCALRASNELVHLESWQPVRELFRFHPADHAGYRQHGGILVYVEYQIPGDTAGPVSSYPVGRQGRSIHGR